MGCTNLSASWRPCLGMFNLMTLMSRNEASQGGLKYSISLATSDFLWEGVRASFPTGTLLGG